MKNSIVAVTHVLLPSQFGKWRVLSLPNVMKLVWVAIAVTWRPSFPNKVGIVIVLPFIPIGKFLLEPLLSAVEGTPVNIPSYQSRAPTNTPLHQTSSDINLRLLTGVEKAHDVIRPSRTLLDLSLEV